MSKQRGQLEVSPLEMTPEQQALITSLKQQSIKASAERCELPCPRCEQPLQVVYYPHLTLQGVNDLVLLCPDRLGCGFSEW
jgi:hypothetical protein